MAARTASWFMYGVNHYVEDLTFHSDVGVDGLVTVSLAAAPALDADGILDGQSIASADSTETFLFTGTDSDSWGGTYGRNVTVVASGAATSTVTVHGWDYLGQPMSETLTLNGTTPVVGVKAFFRLRMIEWGATAATTIDVGWGDRLGLPFRATSTQLLGELVSGATPTAGALTAGVAVATAQTATTADPRGYYTPHSSAVHNGTRTYQLTYFADRTSLYGAAHYSA